MSTDLIPVVKPIFGQKIICEAKNCDQIDAALLMANQGSKTHAFTSSKKILELVNEMEERLLSLLGSKKMGVGARLEMISGAAVPKSFGYMRKATKVSLVRRAKGWAITMIEPTKIGLAGGGTPTLIFSVEQSVCAVAKFKMRNFLVDGYSGRP